MRKNIVLLSLIGLAFGAIDDNCLKCICKLEGCEGQVGKCRDDEGSPSCGPYQIKEVYWIDAGRPGGEYEKCAKEFACSETAIKAYMERYGPGCRDQPNCEDYMRLHNGGPQACKPGTPQYERTNKYWERAKKECGF